LSAILIRAERPSDYHSIAQVNALAFGRAGEAALVDALRHRSDFDPDLSLVALVAGEIVGHALFVPVTLRLAGADVSAAVLSPLAVRPDCQQQGIEQRLLAAGHERARQRGCALALLVGHDSYYPRFGYRTHMYGRVAVRLHRAVDAVAPVPARIAGHRAWPICPPWRPCGASGSATWTSPGRPTRGCVAG
jgi:predicted N-acetyltransferase YhbS